MTFEQSYAAAAARWPAGSDGSLVGTSWGRTHVLAAGSPGAPSVVLLHGDGATATAWAGVAAGLAGRFRVLAPDQPGNPGRSTSSRPFRSTADQVAWLGELLAAATDGPVHLAGHSAGAHLALSYALADDGPPPASLSLLDPTACFTGFSPRYLLRAAPSLVRPTPARVRRFLAWETGGRPLQPAWLDTYVRGATECPRTPIVRTRRPARDRLAGLAVPTLVLVAGRSRAHDPRRLVAGARSALPSVDLQVLPTATHHTMPVLDAPELAAAIERHAQG
ncbi:alpha/beta fold hydrolase [Blastococcus xanthinilyticus]|uniref:Alpha-beta hydrolase superfamily lysophospholipase n=1 Tax=Blastococcus xanthinilyticus TaxID=1564164 RepID=A0A5S5D152_9ACTN|nr:alpha/beta fold hydrolase [Blastococcus xanthinilyticus]TYP89074.1 alpha-beta hydrolase superfamily lysophospholipase [Blastococcus xanthinilyticus]